MVINEHDMFRALKHLKMITVIFIIFNALIVLYFSAPERLTSLTNYKCM
jgi:hypothetical protein